MMKMLQAEHLHTPHFTFEQQTML